MAKIKFKKWTLNDKFTLQDLIDLTPDLEKETQIDFILRAVKVLESKRELGPEITTQLEIKDFAKIQKKLGEALNKAFL